MLRRECPVDIAAAAHWYLTGKQPLFALSSFLASLLPACADFAAGHIVPHALSHSLSRKLVFGKEPAETKPRDLGCSPHDFDAKSTVFKSCVIVGVCSHNVVLGATLSKSPESLHAMMLFLLRIVHAGIGKPRITLVFDAMCQLWSYCAVRIPGLMTRFRCVQRVRVES